MGVKGLGLDIIIRKSVVFGDLPAESPDTWTASRNWCRIRVDVVITDRNEQELCRYVESGPFLDSTACPTDFPN